MDRHPSDGCCGASADFQPARNHSNDLRPPLEIEYRYRKLTLPPLDKWVGGRGPFKFELGQSVLLHSLAHSAMSLLIGDYARHFIVSSSASVCSHSVIFSREQVAWIAIPRMDAVVPALISNHTAQSTTILHGVMALKAQQG